MGAREVVAHANLREGDEDVAHYSATSGTGSEKNTHTHTHTHIHTQAFSASTHDMHTHAQRFFLHPYRA